MKLLLLIITFAATIPSANWLIGNFGTTCIPDGPCLLPVGFGLFAPSGVLMVGLGLVLRDLVHEAGGLKGAVIAILLGTVIAWCVAPPSLVIASAAAFLLSEIADLAVYAPLRRKRVYSAVLLSGLAGAAVDSAVFLLLAFGSLEFISGQILGKLWMSILAMPAIWMIRVQRSA